MKSTKKSDEFKKPSADELKSQLTREQFQVTQCSGTEPPFQNEYWNLKKEGIYVDVVSGEPLFCSIHKFDSGTGWPSFTRPLDPDHLVTREDASIPFAVRVEVRSKNGDSHLGHLFDDGPLPTGMRYCINSAALRFIERERLAAEGYERFLPLFQSSTETATLAGGCFWGVEEILSSLVGVLKTEVGYCGGSTDQPTYETVKKGNTGHAESVQLAFDPQKISYEDLLRIFFRLHDPTTKNQQGNDRGSQYRSIVFYHTEMQKKIALQVKEEVEHSGKWKNPLVTEVIEFKKFFSAEKEHQKYLERNPGGYTCHYLRD